MCLLLSYFSDFSVLSNKKFDDSKRFPDRRGGSKKKEFLIAE
jgi:hypothetical protein